MPWLRFRKSGIQIEVEPPDRIGQELADREGPGLAVRQEALPGDGRDRLGGSQRMCASSAAVEPWVLLGRRRSRAPEEPARRSRWRRWRGRPTRHPQWRVIQGTARGVTSAPTFVPELKMPVAKARSFFGNHSATVLMEAGKLPASPRPSTNRASAKPAAAPVSRTKEGGLVEDRGHREAGDGPATCAMAARLHRTTATAKPIFVPMPSITRPRSAGARSRRRAGRLKTMAA